MPPNLKTPSIARPNPDNGERRDDDDSTTPTADDDDGATELRPSDAQDVKPKP